MDAADDEIIEWNPELAYCQWPDCRFAFHRSVQRWDVSVSGRYAYPTIEAARC